MPREDELLPQTKQRFPDQRIILLSAYADMPQRVLWLMDDYVMRSEPLEQLAEVVERVMKGAHTNLEPSVLNS